MAAKYLLSGLSAVLLASPGFSAEPEQTIVSTYTDDPLSNAISQRERFVIAQGIPLDEEFKADLVEVQGQVTSVSQLSDVQPTDWAFQALQSLVERYGCIAGYLMGLTKAIVP